MVPSCSIYADHGCARTLCCPRVRFRTHFTFTSMLILTAGTRGTPQRVSPLSSPRCARSALQVFLFAASVGVMNEPSREKRRRVFAKSLSPPHSR